MTVRRRQVLLFKKNLLLVLVVQVQNAQPDCWIAKKMFDHG